MSDIWLGFVACMGCWAIWHVVSCRRRHVERGLHWTPRAMRVLRRSIDVARASRVEWVGVEHLFRAIAEEDGWHVHDAARNLGVDLGGLADESSRLAYVGHGAGHALSWTRPE